MKDKTKKIRDTLISISLIVILTYFTIINNLYKLTGKNEWTILKSPALFELIALTIVFVLVVILIKIIKKKRTK